MAAQFVVCRTYVGDGTGPCEYCGFPFGVCKGDKTHVLKTAVAPLCELEGCTRPRFLDSKGNYSRACGRTHLGMLLAAPPCAVCGHPAFFDTRRGQFSQTCSLTCRDKLASAPAVPVCQKPGCGKLCWWDPRGFYSPACGRSHL